jgi:predicted dithiol-disulfide oxidoreductase (DUF899 family)
LSVEREGPSVDLSAVICRLTVEQVRAGDCKDYSFVLDAMAGGLVGRAAGDRSAAADSHAPLAKIAAFKRRINLALLQASSANFIFN